MPKPARPWFRLYSEALDNPKVQGLKPVLFKHWFNLMCLASITQPRGELPVLATVAFRLRIRADRVKGVVDELVHIGLIDHADGRFTMHDWDEWQWLSDANLTPGRAAKTERGAAEIGAAYRPRSAAITRGNGGDNAAITRRRSDTEQKQNRTETEADAETRALPKGFSYKTEPLEPDEPGFVGEYVRHYEQRHGKHPPGTHLGDARSLERDFGTAACVQAAADLDWDKPPAYLRPRMEDQRGKSNGANSGQPPARTGTERVAARLRGLG